MVEALTSVSARGPISWCEEGCRTQRGKREALEVVVQDGPGFRSQAARMSGGLISDANQHSRRFQYAWDQGSLGIEAPLDTVPIEDMQQFFTTVKSAWLRLAAVHTHDCKYTRSSSQPHPGRAPAEPRRRDPQLVTPDHRTGVYPPGPAALAGRSRQEARAFRVVRAWRHHPPVPVADGVHGENIHAAQGCSPRSLGRDEV